MAEIISCPECGRKLQVPESYYGQKVQCPQCEHQFIADPNAQSIQTAPPAAAPTVAYDAPEAESQPRRRRKAKDAYDDDDDYDDDDEYSVRRPMRRSHIPHRGGLILALGLVALIGGMSIYLPLIIGPIAWIMGNYDLNEIRAGRMDPSGEGLVQAGRVLGIVATVFLIIGVLIVLSCIGIIFANRG